MSEYPTLHNMVRDLMELVEKIETRECELVQLTDEGFTALNAIVASQRKRLAALEKLSQNCRGIDKLAEIPELDANGLDKSAIVPDGEQA